MRSLLWVLILAPVLCGWTACQRRPSPPQVVEVPGPTKYVPIDPRLTKRCPIEEPKSSAPLEAARVAKERRNALEQCNRQLQGIEAVQGTTVP